MCGYFTDSNEIVCSASPLETSWISVRRREGGDKGLLRKPETKHVDKNSLQWTLHQANSTQLLNSLV